MSIKFFIKKFPKKYHYSINKKNDINEEKIIVNDKNIVKKNKKAKNKEHMDLKDKIEQIEDTLISMEPEIKIVKSDKGLIERTESSKIVITEDNRQLLRD